MNSKTIWTILKIIKELNNSLCITFHIHVFMNISFKNEKWIDQQNHKASSFEGFEGFKGFKGKP